MAPIISSIAEWKDLAHKDGEGSQAPAPQRPKSDLSGDSAKEQERRNVEHDFVEAVHKPSEILLSEKARKAFDMWKESDIKTLY